MVGSVDREKLLKVLALADSDQPAEALNAWRVGSRLVRDAGLQWEDVIVLGPRRGWRYHFDLWARYVSEVKRRLSAERSAQHWHTIAKLREAEITRLKSAGAVAATTDAPRVTGHSLIDRLLASSDLDAARRARVEAIASWFNRTRELTVAEQADLETFSRQIGAS